LVHSHIQVAFETGAEPAVGGIELVTANPQIGQNAIYLGYFVQPAKPLQMPEIVRNENDTIISWHIFPGICILVKNNHSPIGIELFENFQGMPAATKGTINIHPIGADV
jgi:hypothetical protein